MRKLKVLSRMLNIYGRVVIRGSRSLFSFDLSHRARSYFKVRKKKETCALPRAPLPSPCERSGILYGETVIGRNLWRNVTMSTTGVEPCRCRYASKLRRNFRFRAVFSVPSVSVIYLSAGAISFPSASRSFLTSTKSL